MKVKLTYSLAMAAGHDAATLNMRKNHRKKWNQEDYDIAIKTVNALLGSAK